MNCNGLTVIADAGGTSTGWIAFDASGRIQERTESGPINASQSCTEAIIEALEPVCTLLAGATEVWFYGAGCKGDTVIKAVADAIHRYTPAPVHAESDMLGVARALLGRQPGIACILGTGANTCRYDGHDIVQCIPPLGYILGDEGSGAAIGKRFLRMLYRNELPNTIQESFADEYELTYPSMIEKVYRGSRVNTFLASLSRFVAQRLSTSEVRQIVLDEFDDFFKSFILHYPEASHNRLCFAGSIAYHFRAELEEVATRYGFTLGKICASPLDDLARYHIDTNHNNQ